MHNKLCYEQDAEKERLRLRAEIARDKEARKLNKGVLPSVLGVDGYNPSIVQYNQPIPTSTRYSTTSSSTSTSTTSSSSTSTSTSSCGGSSSRSNSSTSSGGSS